MESKRHCVITIWTVFLFAVASHLTSVAAASDNCVVAYSYYLQEGRSLCDSTGLSLDQLKTEACPSACQGLYDDVLANCTVGDVYDENLPTFLYAEDRLFLSEGHKWAGCNYGYNFTACQRSYRVLEENDFPCSLYGSTKEELASSPCPEQCQELYNDVVANCEPNVGIYVTPTATLGIASFAIYREAVLWNEYGRRQQCDFGYSPTSCDIAIRELSDDTIGILDLYFGPNSTVCDNEDNENVCTAECIKLIDAVLSDCPVGAEFAPSGGYLSKTHQRIPFEGPETLSNLGIEPSFFPSLSLSQLCWDYYKARSPPQSAFDGAMPTVSLAAPTASPIQNDGDAKSRSPMQSAGMVPIASPMQVGEATPIPGARDEPTPSQTQPIKSSALTYVPGSFVIATGYVILSCMFTTFYC